MRNLGSSHEIRGTYTVFREPADNPYIIQGTYGELGSLYIFQGSQMEPRYLFKESGKLVYFFSEPTEKSTNPKIFLRNRKLEPVSLFMNRSLWTKIYSDLQGIRTRNTSTLEPALYRSIYCMTRENWLTFATNHLTAKRLSKKIVEVPWKFINQQHGSLLHCSINHYRTSPWKLRLECIFAMIHS